MRRARETVLNRFNFIETTTVVNMSSSTLVTVADDADNRLVSLLAASGRPTFAQDCEQCLLNGDAAALLKVIITDQGAMKELLNGEEAAFSLLAAILDRVSDPEQEGQLAVAMANAVETHLTDKDQQLRFLSALYNLRSRPQEKCFLLVKMITLTATLDGRLGELVDNILPLLDSWAVGQQERRPLYKAIALKDGSRKQKFTLLLLQTYSDAVSSQTFDLDRPCKFQNMFPNPSYVRATVVHRQGRSRGSDRGCFRCYS